jgi:S1-C subfamily serine protease
MMLGAPDIVLYNPQDQTWQVMMLSEDGPLYTAGLRPNDVITAVMIDGESIAAENLAQALADAADDAQATLAVTRGDETLEITVEARALDVIGRFTGMGLFRGDRMPFQMIGGTVRLGVVYTMLDADSAAENELAVTEGALITQVLADTPAAEAGLQVNDVITAVNGQPVNVDNDLRARLAGHAAGDTITLDVQRGDEALTLEVTLAPNEFGFSLRGMGMPFNFDFGELPEFFFNPEGGFRFFGPGGRLPFDIEIPPLQPAPQTVPMT